MTTVNGTVLAIVFATERRSNSANDLAIAKSVGSRLTGTFHPSPNSAVSVFPSTIDSVRSAIAAANWYSKASGGLNGIGIGIDDSSNTESALLLAERGLTNVLHNIFLTDPVFRKVQNLPGLKFEEVEESILPGREGRHWIYGLTTNVGEFSEFVDAATSDDTAGWDTEPIAREVEPPTIPSGATGDLAETIVSLDGNGELVGEIAGPPDSYQSTNSESKPTSQSQILNNTLSNSVDSSEDDDTTLVDALPPSEDFGARTKEAISLQEALKLMEQCEEPAQRFRSLDQPYSAIYEIDQVLTNNCVQNLEGLEGPVEKLQALRYECLAGKGISKGLLISSDGNFISIHRGPSLMIGRDPGNDTAGIKLHCQTLSRIPKQLRIDRHGESFSIMDLGSTNGSFLNDTQLIPNQSVPLEQLSQGATLSLGGVLNPPEKGECRLNLSTLGGENGTLQIQVQTSHMTEPLRAQLATNWPHMDRDCAGRWLYTEEPVLIGSGQNCGLHVAPEECSDAIACIEWSENGYILAPRSDQVKIDGAPILQPVLILGGATLSILGQDYQLDDNGG